MSANADPDPQDTPGLEPGGSVPPGETPPAETSSTSELADGQPELPSTRTNKVMYGLILGITAVVGIMFVAYALSIG
ncbi:DUF6480 family protein [Cellulomonas bogoriensis]|uniref:Uncharacterized protein n=1 Tax=Cellulomonas bogoriensis 69B4 = DSM 16987 TaxID=1386082 RepID=A0A0A0BJA1_9CELL|nr:DUF6480 family protein [Cellulomonas bogoriensis]KGM08588.1 hypothetical protein N869_09915 [Cellulomonas bogoriensis 69B4 = DSM 16987]